MKFLFLFLIISPALCHEWIRKDAKFDFLNEHLVYRNRADCAARATSPTRSVFLMVDNVNVAKAAFRLAKIKEIDSLQTTALAVEKFRYSLTNLTSRIGQMLLTGELPLIEEGKSSDEEVERKWAQRLKTSNKGELQCRLIKKFGSVHSPINVSRPDHFLLQELGVDLEKIENTFGSCHDFSDSQSTDVALFRFDVVSDSTFDGKGFHFWASLKVYLAWALRYSREMKELSSPFYHLLKNVDIEEMILFLSAGCESLSSPQCSERDLSLDSLMDLTAPVKEFNVDDSPFFRKASGSQTDELFSRPLPLKEDDLLHLNSFQSTEEWIENYRGNFLKARGYQKIRLSRASSNLIILSASSKSDEMKDRLLQEAQVEDPEWKQQFFYLCSEYNGASGAHFSNLLKDLSLMKENNHFRESVQALEIESLDEIIKFYQNLSFAVKNICSSLEEKKTWEGIKVDRSGLAPWYLQQTGSPVTIQQFNLKGSKAIQDSFISINDGDVFCQTAVHCARIMLDSLMTLSAVSHQLPALSPTEILSTNLGNPFASRVACGIYDPWEKRNKMIYNFFHDLAQAAVFGFLPSPVYVSVDIDPKKVTSFETLLKDGKIFYDPVYSKRKMHLSLISDLGPLIGVPCAVSISGSRINPLEYYSFSGISFSGCRESGRNDIRVTSGEEVKRDISFNQVCGACAINLRTVSAAVGRLHPAIRFSSFLLKGVVRLVHGVRDPHDVPKSWVVKPQQVALSYRYWGNITPWCLKKILKGQSCIPKTCERKMIEELTTKYNVSPTSSQFNCFLQRGMVNVKECSEPLFLSMRGTLKLKTECKLAERQ
jgi:hypothetical protein